MKKRFDKVDIEKAVLHLLLKERSIFLKYKRWIKSEYFSGKYRKFIIGSILRLDDLLTLTKFKNEIKKRKKKLGLKASALIKYESVYLNILNLKVDKADTEYVFGELFKFHRVDETMGLMLKYIGYVDNGELDEAEKLLVKGVNTIKKEALAEEIDMGEVVEDVQERIDYINDRKNHPEKYMGEKTGIKRLDRLTGGLWKGELGMVFGVTGIGKSIMLLQFAHATRIRGKNVLYITMEMPKIQIEQRYDSLVTGMEYRKKFKFAKITPKEMRLWKKRLIGTGKFGGKFKVVAIPNDCTASLIKSIMEEDKEKGILYDIVIIDYIDLMRYDGRAWSEQDEQGKIAAALKGLAMKWHIPVWIATQQRITDEARENLEHRDVGYSRKKIHYCDLVMGINRTEEDKAKSRETMTLHITKWRDGGNIKFTIYPDLDIMRIDKNDND